MSPLLAAAVSGLLAAFAGLVAAVAVLAVLLRRDRAARRRAEGDLQTLLDTARAEKEWYSLVLDSMNEEVYFTDTRRRYTYVNHAVAREFGHVERGVELGKVVSGLEVLRPDGSPRPIDEAPPLRSLKGEVVRDERQLVRNPLTGELRHRIVSSAPVRSAAGEVIGAVSLVRDVTDQQRVEDALREADRRKNLFLASLSHELRNPLAPIRSAARVLESPAASPQDVRRSAAVISRQAAHLGALLDDLLEVSRFTRGELVLEKQSVPLQELIDGAVEVARPLVEARRHRLRVEAPSPPLVLEADPVRLTQVLSNLLTNAAKYTEPGGEITLGARLEPGALVAFVRDTGIGIAPEMRERIFDMFVQADPARSRAGGGLGIGLALVRSIAESHGGTVSAASEGAGRGSTFTLTLPRSIVAAPAAAPAADDGRRRATVRRSCRILVADDNEDGAASLGMLLEAAGHEVHLAYDGEQALAAAERARPQVALLDIGMPRLDGYEVAARIRREPWGASMKLVAMTGWGQEADKLAARRAGFDLHLTKPLDPAALESLLGE